MGVKGPFDPNASYKSMRLDNDVNGQVYLILIVASAPPGVQVPLSTPCHIPGAQLYSLIGFLDSLIL